MEMTDILGGLILFVAILGMLGTWFLYVDSRNDVTFKHRRKR